MRARAVVLVRTTRPGKKMARTFASMRGVDRVDRVLGPYQLVVHTSGADEIGAIERLADVTRADVCWLSADPEGGSQ
jgi:hypothetical protein